MYNRRWYDKYTDTNKTLDLLKNLEDYQQKLIADNITEIANSIKNYHKEKEIVPLSIGLQRVFGLYQARQARRWYDKKTDINNAVLNISTLPEQDYQNIMRGLNSALNE